MPRTRHNPRLAKLHRSYTVEEISRLFGVCRNTVRAWMKAGLPALDGRRPVLIHGAALRSFLEARRAAVKRPCPAGTIYCFKCREPRRPALDMADFIPRPAGAGNISAICETCGSIMHRRASYASLGAILPGIDIRVASAPAQSSRLA